MRTSICFSCGSAREVEIEPTPCARCHEPAEASAEAFCDACDREWSVPTSAVEIDGAIYCAKCSTPPAVWCPACRRLVEGRPYLWLALEPTVFHAASLVTHYRHNHVRYYERAYQNRYYARKIPGYNHDDLKLDVNNRAKRQLLRALANAVKEKAVPSDVDPIALARAFTQLQHTDEATVTLVDTIAPKIAAMCNAA